MEPRTLASRVRRDMYTPVCMCMGFTSWNYLEKQCAMSTYLQEASRVQTCACGWLANHVLHGGHVCVHDAVWNNVLMYVCRRAFATHVAVRGAAGPARQMTRLRNL